MRKRLKVGDIVIFDYNSEHPHLGIIKKIELDRYGDQNKVFMLWQKSQPRNYNADAGYCGFNITNLRHQFKVIRQ